MTKKVKKVVSGLVAFFCLLSTMSIPAFASGYDVIREPWLDALMGSEHIVMSTEFDEPLLLYPTVFKNGTATLYEKSYVEAGYEATFYCDTMYKVNYNGDAITEKKTADSFSFTPSYEGEHVQIPDFEGAYWEENVDKIIFYPNEWTWCENENLEHKTSNKYFEKPNYVTFLGDLYGYGYYDWADYQLKSSFDEYGRIIPDTSVCSYKYYNGVSTAFCNGKAGVIDEDDNVIVPFEYDMILPVANEEGYAWVLRDGKWGIIKVNTADVTVSLNNNEIEFDQAPIIINGRTLVPLRAIFEALEATVEWNGETQTVTSTKGNITVSMTIGKNEIIKNGEKTILDTAPRIIGERTLIPARAVAEAFECNVDWNEATRTVIISG